MLILMSDDTNYILQIKSQFPNMHTRVIVPSYLWPTLTIHFYNELNVTNSVLMPHTADKNKLKRQSGCK